MTDQSIGTARLDIVVDTTNLESGVERAKKAQDGLSQSSTRATQTQEQNSKRQIAALEKQIATLGKSREEIVRWRIETQTAGDVQKRLLANFDATTAKLNSGAAAFSRYGVSAKQQAAALRGVPAQITDIVTALQGGQRPLTVLLQQGGQLKDMFGGIVPAARALGGAVLGLINPFTLAAAAVVGIAVAFNKVSEEQAAFTKALILSGNVASLTTQQLEDMAGALDETTSATGGRARDTLAQVAVSGKFTAEQMQLVAQAAINMEDATGQAVSKTVEQFARLEDDPVKAILKLNGAINDGTNVTNFLTRAQIDAIEKFEEQGKSAEAAKVAIEAYAAAINDRAPEITKNLGFFASVWRQIKIESGDAVDVVLDGFRKMDTEAKKLSQNSFFRTLVAGAAPVLPGGFTLSGAVNNAGKPPEPTFIGFKSGAKPVNSRDEEARIAAEKEFAQLAESNLSKREKLESEINEIRSLGVKAGKSELEIQAQINNARKRYQESLPKGAKGTSLEAASSRAAIQALEDQLKKEQGLIANQTKLLEANYSARNVTVEHYYAEQKRLAQENSTAQVKALEGEIAALQSRSLKGKDSINNARELAQKEAELAKVRADGATALEVLNIQEAAQIKQRQQANIAYADALSQGRDALKAELDSQVLRITVGEREFEIRSRIIQLYRDEAKELLNLARQRDAGEIDPETYKARVEQLRATIAEEVKIVRDGYDQMAEAQKNWANGALKAFADYNDAANDVAGQTYTIFSDAISGLEDVFVDFFTKGKADWKGFFDDIAAEITRFVVRQQLNKLIQKFLPGKGGEEGDNAAALSSAAASLAASAAPLYGAAAALSASAAALAAAGVGEAVSGGGDTGGASTGSGWGSWIQIAASLFANAKGNAFDNGNVVPFAKGGVFDQSTLFGMGAGRMGVMGEAGPEAVMPLKRGPDGKLGVVASGGSSQFTQHNHITLLGRPDRQTPEQVARASGREARRGMARTG